MKATQLPIETQAALGFTHKVVIKATADATTTDLTAAATTQTLNVLPASGGNFAAGHVVLRTGYRLVTAFSGGAASALTVQVGDSAAANTFITAQSVWGAATPINHVVSQTGKAYNAADNIRVLITATGANVSTITAGELHLYVQLVDLTQGDGN